MTDESDTSSNAGCASAHRTPENGLLKHSLPKRLALYALEALLVLIVIGLLIATWLPAIIGANPDAPRNTMMP